MVHTILDFMNLPLIFQIVIFTCWIKYLEAGILLMRAQMRKPYSVTEAAELENEGQNHQIK